MKTFLGNVFSLQMVPTGAELCARVCSPVGARRFARNATSVVGHADTARVFARALGVPVAHNRANITLARGDLLLVGQVVGGRLPEGATTLPAGVSIQWMLVEVLREPAVVPDDGAALADTLGSRFPSICVHLRAGTIPGDDDPAWDEIVDLRYATERGGAPPTAIRDLGRLGWEVYW